MMTRLFPAWSMVDRDALHGSTAVVIDVLRATSTIIAAVDNGAGSIIPVEDIETASRLVGQAERGVKLLAGEWKGQPVEGFDLFNSPSEFTRENVEGRTIIFSTTNGTRAIIAASRAERLVICSFNNISAVAANLTGEKDINVICAGNSGRISAEDVLCGGMLIDMLVSGNNGTVEGDSGVLALMVARRYDGKISDFLEGCERGKSLISSGYGKDLDYCSMLDSTSIVPEVIDGRVIGARA